MFRNKKVLITGGTGSFGQAVVKRFLDSEMQEIRIFSRDEKKQWDMRRQFDSKHISFWLGDVRDERSVTDAMQGVDLVFHAAALKQVPSCEFYPMEAVKTNVLGTEHVLQAAIKEGVQKVIVLSTDKGVYPINAMGMTKALMEKVMIAMSRSVHHEKQVLCGTRYGNIMCSRGSVIPLFIEQIKKREPLSITDPQMTRYLMSLETSIELVLFAFEYGGPGDIFVQKAPACSIGDLALAVKEVFGVDNPIKIIGTRHGEKLHETLLTREEMVRSEDLGDYYRIPADTRDLNYAKYYCEGEERISVGYDYDSRSARQLTIEEIKQILLNLEYVKKELAVYGKARITKGAFV